MAIVETSSSEDSEIKVSRCHGDTERTAYTSASANNEDVGEEEDEKLFSFLTGMKNDLVARKPFYNMKGDGIGDWGRPQNFFTVFNATIFAFVIQLIPALVFAELMDRETEGNLSTSETILSSAIMGIIYTIFAGQPLTILGMTGPVCLFLGTSYGLAEQFNADYFPFFFWICLWAGLLHIIAAAVGLVNLVWMVTPFTTQIFELFISISFIYSALRDLLVPVHLLDSEATDPETRSAGYAHCIIGMITFYVATSLHYAENGILFPRLLRTLLTSYNTLIAVVIATAVSYIPGVDQDGSIDRVNVIAPWNWQPSADRAWVVNPLEGIGLEGIFGALIPGIMFFLLFIIDHNVSSILTQSPKFNLQKPPAYHWDFFVLGITFLPCAILGLPPGNGLLPQAPLHVRALCTRTIETDEYGVKKEVVSHCEEQRWSALGQAVMMFVALGAFSVISRIPTGCLFGLLLYLGTSSLHENEVWERLLLLFVSEDKRPKIPVVRYVEWRVVQMWTLVQVVCAILIWAIGQYLSVGHIYPLLLTLLVPLRSVVLERCFDSNDLRHLDPADESEADFHEEQRMVHHAMTAGIAEQDDMAFPTRAEFRGQGMKRALMNTKRRHTIGGNGEKNDILAIEIAKACIDLDLDLDDSASESSEVKPRPPSFTDLVALNRTDVKLKASNSIADLMALNNSDRSLATTPVSTPKRAPRRRQKTQSSPSINDLMPLNKSQRKRMQSCSSINDLMALDLSDSRMKSSTSIKDLMSLNNLGNSKSKFSADSTTPRRKNSRSNSDLGALEW